MVHSYNNSKSYTADPTAPTSMTLSDLGGHFSSLKPF